MGHQVNFFVVPADLPNLELAIRSTGEVCFLADKAQKPGLNEVDSIASEATGGPPRLHMYYIVRRSELPAVRTRFIEAQRYWVIEGAGSPVIEFMPGVFTGTTLIRGRAYFASDLRSRSELPSPDFIRWGDQVLTRIKRKLTRHPDLAPPWLYFGANALQWIDSSGAVLTGGATALSVSGCGEPAALDP